MRYQDVTLTPELLNAVLADPEAEGLRVPEGAALFRARALATLDAVDFPTAWVTLDRGRPVAAFGTMLHYPGRAEGWMIFVQGAGAKTRTSVARMANRRMNELQRSPWFRRIEMWVLAGAPWAATFSRALGMRCEGTAEAWDPAGRDYRLYARVAPTPQIEKAAA